MNLEDIKRNLNRRKTNFSEVITPSTLPPPPPVATPAGSPEWTMPKGRLANEIFSNPDEEEDLPPPNSEIWCDSLGALDLDSVRRTIADLELDDEKYDWRRETKKGKSSRKNFSDFLKISM